MPETWTVKHVKDVLLHGWLGKQLTLVMMQQIEPEQQNHTQQQKDFKRQEQNSGFFFFPCYILFY